MGIRVDEEGHAGGVGHLEELEGGIQFTDGLAEAGGVDFDGDVRLSTGV